MTYAQALDSMFASVKATLDASGMSLVGYKPDTRWPGVPIASPPDKTKLWARVSVQIATDGQAALANFQGITLYEAMGLLYVQLFCPRNLAASLPNGRLVAIALQATFRSLGATGDIWYRNAKFVELPETDDNYPVTFSTVFEYNTLS